jgi:Phosphotransferase enzyme family
MKGRIRRCPPFLFKRYATANAAKAAAELSIRLGGHGVLTPNATHGAGSRLVQFDLIAAETGLVAFSREAKAVLPLMMKSLVTLHAVKPCEGVEPYEPLRKITPRLTAGHNPLRPLLSEALNELETLKVEAGLIHGDLHVGQFLLDGEEKCWLIDFDDVAIGDPAADLGNFAAHLATRPETSGGAPLVSMRHWLAVVLYNYRQAGGFASAHSADVYGRLALVRRALKLSQGEQAGQFHDLRSAFNLTI